MLCMSLRRRLTVFGPWSQFRWCRRNHEYCYLTPSEGKDPSGAPGNGAPTSA